MLTVTLIARYINKLFGKVKPEGLWFSWSLVIEFGL